jgi:hypothetical protein
VEFSKGVYFDDIACIFLEGSEDSCKKNDVLIYDHSLG